MTTLHVNRLQKDKDSLLVQVDVLSERLEAQTAKVRPLNDKVKQLEKECLKYDEENDQLKKSVLQVIFYAMRRVVLFTSGLMMAQETQKRSTLQLQLRDMMAEVSSLKRQTATSGRATTLPGKMNRVRST